MSTTPSLFLHKDCGGHFYVDISTAFEWNTPSLSIQPEGISIGVTEFRSIKLSGNGPSLRCDKCGKSFSFSASIKTTEVTCFICGDVVPVSEAGTARQILCACKTCQDIINGKEKPANPRQERVVEFIFLGNAGRISFTPLSDLLKRSIKF